MSRTFIEQSLIAMMTCMLIACGSSGSTSEESTTTTTGDNLSVSDLSSLPDIEDIVSADGTSAALSLLKAVSGTPPNLVDIDDTAADTLFWDGLVADINTNGLNDPDDQSNFWQGEGRCRMAQDVGYSFQEINMAGTSLCYMKNAPSASGGVSVVSGDLSDPSTLFNQSESSRLVKVQVSGMGDMPGETGSNSQEIFIRVYGSSTTEGSAGYAVDLWFCSESGQTAGYQLIRVNNSTGALTLTNAETSFGNFTMEFTGKLTEDASGNPIFDSAQAQSADFVFEDPQFGTHKGHVTVNGSTMISRGWNSYTTQEGQSETRRSYVQSTYSGTSTATLKFLSAGFAVEWSVDGQSDAFYGGAEYQDTKYVSSESVDHFTTANNYDFDADSFWSGSLAIDADVMNAISNYSCSATPDIVVAMDMSNTTLQTEVVSVCENAFSEMNFCDSQSIQQARSAIFSQGFGDE
ncbi:MAG: hypothetical protein HYV02_00900 [Deltaproteobacteria bacterium]|nr:hypothetical protein [Deltaproteobacteria bacterium]